MTLRKKLGAGGTLALGMSLGLGLPDYAPRLVSWATTRAPEARSVAQRMPPLQLSTVAAHREVPVVNAHDESSELSMLRESASDEAFARNLPLDRNVAADEEIARWPAHLRVPDLDVLPTKRVMRALRNLTQTNEGRKFVRTALRRSGKYRVDVLSALRAEGLPDDLQAVVFAESAYEPTAVSRKGASGLWQLLPETGRVYGLHVDDDVDERRDPRAASPVAVKFLNDLHKRFGSWSLAFAAYNMGYRALVEQIREQSTNSFEALASSGFLPRETIDYVPRVIALAVVLRNLDKFGFDNVHLDEPVACSPLNVPSGSSLRSVARASGTSLSQLLAMNPAIVGEHAPDRGADVNVCIPSEGIGRAQAMLTELLDSRSDHLEDRVAADFDWGKDELPAVDEDQGPSNRMARADDDIFEVPRERSRSERRVEDEEAPRDRNSKRHESKAAYRGHNVKKIYDTEPSDYVDASRKSVYFVRTNRDDTIASIARRHGVREDEVIAINRLDPRANLHPGMVLKVPGRESPTRGSSRDFAESESQDVASLTPSSPSLRRSGEKNVADAEDTVTIENRTPRAERVPRVQPDRAW